MLHDYANKFGFNNPKQTIPLPVTPSVFPPVTDPAFTAYQAIGQFSDRVTPLQEAMIAETIANGGRMMAPYLVKEVQAPDLARCRPPRRRSSRARSARPWPAS